ncbi:MAG: hypothetical protein HC845_15230 [Akkermansiaceae bacterium]|nr:hypothetical protein [Akkermansiaceae bacterium]
MNLKYLLKTAIAFFLWNTSFAMAAPNPPSDFKVQAVGVNAFQLTWTSNSADETGWRISAASRDEKPQSYALIPTTSVQTLPDNKRSFLLFTPPTTGRTLGFSLASYNGAAGQEAFSKETAIATVKVPSSETFGTPTKLKAKVINDGAVLLSWKDNSTVENGYIVQVKAGSAKEWQALTLVSPRKSFKIPIGLLQPGTNYSFRIRAYIGDPNAPIRRTKFTKAVTVKTPLFVAPSDLVATPEGEGAFSFKWKDNSSSEIGFQLETRVNGGEFVLRGSSGANSTFADAVPNFELNADHQFRLRAFRVVSVKQTKPGSNPPVEENVEQLIFSDYSNVFSVRSTGLKAPSELVATPEGEGAFSFSWKDNSSIETGFELQTSLNGAAFISNGTTGANSTSANGIPNFTLSADHQFRVRAFRSVSGVRIDSEFSNVFPARSTGLNAPTNLAATGSTSTSATVNWKDESAREGRNEIEYRVVGDANFQTFNVNSSSGISAAALTGTVSNLLPFTNYEFRVRAAANSSNTDSQFSIKSGYSNLVQVRTKDGIIGDLNPQALTVGTPFLYTVQVTRPAELVSITVTGLPAGLAYNEAPRTITGTPTTTGTFNVTLRATFSDGTISETVLMIASAPIVVQAFSPVNVAASANSVVSTTGKFSDPDTQSAARINTTKGSFDIIFYPIATPLTVDNFMDYMDAMRYDNTFFHRAPANFVVQGGGYKHTTADGFSRVVTFPAVMNEPGISNVRSTVAMAKLGGDPNSATSQFFINLGDNSANLDVQNGGFTVFGRVPTSGMVIIDQIGALPRRNYNVPIGSGSDPLSDVPIDAATAPVTLDPALLVKITTTGPAPILTYTAISANPAIATATVTGTDVTITGVATGSTTIQVTATDLDGLTVSQSITVTVP